MTIIAVQALPHCPAPPVSRLCVPGAKSTLKVPAIPSQIGANRNRTRTRIRNASTRKPTSTRTLGGTGLRVVSERPRRRRTRQPLTLGQHLDPCAFLHMTLQLETRLQDDATALLARPRGSCRRC